MKAFFPGIEGSYAHSICEGVYKSYEAVACHSPESAVQHFSSSGSEDILILPIENSIGGKVADIHELLPILGNFFIFDEQYFDINHCLLGVRGTSLDDIKEVRSHLQALKQCSRFIEIHRINKIESSNTASAAKEVAVRKDRSIGAIASKETANFYNLDILYEGIQNSPEKNFTRFFAIRKDNTSLPKFEKKIKYLTCLYYSTKNTTASLFKSLIGFSTYGINIVKLESFLLTPNANNASFYIEIEGHPDSGNVRCSIDELRYYCSELRHMGTFKRHI